MLEHKQETSNETRGSYTYDEAVELTGHGRYNYLLLLTCCVSNLAVGLDMFGFALIVTAAKCDLQMGLTEIGVLASAPFAGMMFTYPMGYYADTRGRKQALVLATGISFIFAAISSFSPNWQLMMLLKVISCDYFTFTISSSSSTCILMNTFIGECTGSAHRSKYIFILNGLNFLSDSVSFGLAYFLLPLQFNYPITFISIKFRPWRLLTLIMALPLGIGGFMTLYLHESPKFLASRGDSKKSLEVLKNIYVRNGGKQDEYPVWHLKITDSVEDQKSTFCTSLVQQTAPIFKPPLLWRTLQLTYLMIVCVSTNNTFVMWFPEIVNMFFNNLSGLWDTELSFCNRLSIDQMPTNISIPNDVTICDDTVSQYTIFSGIFYSLFFCFMNVAVSKVASYRKIVLMFWLVVACVSSVLIDLYQPVASLIFFVTFQTTAIGLPSLSSYLVDLYPTSCRGIASSVSETVTRLCSLAAVNLVGAVITDYCSITFYAWAGFIFSGIVVAFLLPSDKMMKSIEIK